MKVILSIPSAPFDSVFEKLPIRNPMLVLYTIYLRFVDLWLVVALENFQLAFIQFDTCLRKPIGTFSKIEKISCRNNEEQTSLVITRCKLVITRKQLVMTRNQPVITGNQLVITKNEKPTQLVKVKRGLTSQEF